MVYKKYKIQKKEIFPNQTRFELNGNIEFSNGRKQNYFLCLNRSPFKNCQIGDEIEINLIDDSRITIREVPKNVSRYMDIDDVSQLDNEETKSQLTLKQKQLSAYNKIIIHRIFRNTLEWLEKYVGLVYPDYQFKKQIYDNKIKREDANDPNEIEKLFVGALSGFKSMLEMEGKPPKYFYDEIKNEYYEYLGSAGIDVNNCPPRLKHFLFEINEILEGRGDKIEKELKNRDRSGEIDPSSPEYGRVMNELFAKIQYPLEDARNEFSSLEGKTDKDIKSGNNFGASGEQAEKAFKQIAGNHDYQGFNFFPQKEKQQSQPREQLRENSLSQQQSNLLEIQYDRALGKWNRQILWDRGETPEGLQRWMALLQFKLKKEKWKVDWVKKFKGSWTRQPIWELALIHPNANLSEENGYDYLGNLKDAYVVDAKRTIMKIHLVKNYPIDQQNELREFRRDFVLSEYEKVQRKLNNDELESWENREKTNEWSNGLENEIKSQQYLKQSPNQQTSLNNQQTNNNNFPKPLIFGGLSLVILAFGLIVYKVKKNKIKN